MMTSCLQISQNRLHAVLYVYPVCLFHYNNHHIGINAQMAVPSNVLENFKAACETLPIFKDLYLNTDHKLSREEYEKTRPFKALHVRPRDQIVADGFDEPLNWEVRLVSFVITSDTRGI